MTLTNIPHVESKVFQPYLSQVGSLYDVFQQERENSADRDLVRGPKAPPKQDDLGSMLSRERRLSTISTSSRATSSRATSPYGSRIRQSSSGQRRSLGVTPLSTVPPVYFEDDFHLENPRTFDVVSEKSEVIRPPLRGAKDDTAANGTVAEPAHMGRKALATNAILQEKLSWYLDTVEMHLISSISNASKSFFTALGSLRELHSEAADSVERIQTLRKDLQKIDKEMALGGLKIVTLRRRRENIRMLADAVAQLHEVVQSISRCDELVENGDIEEAADGLDDVEKLIAGDEPSSHTSEDDGTSGQSRRLIDLRKVKALECASADISQLRSRIGMGYESRLLDDLLSDLRKHVQSVPADVTLQRWGYSFQRQRGGQRSAASASPAYMSFDETLRSRLHTQLSGLARALHITPATTSFKTAVLREVKGLIRQHLPSSSDDDTESMVSVLTQSDRHRTQQEKSSILARNLRALDAEDAYNMFTRIYTGISESLRRLSVQVKVLLDLASGLGSPGAGSKSSRSPSTPNIDGKATSGPENGTSSTVMAQDEILQVLDMSSLLGQAVDIAQSQIVKVLKVRTPQTLKLPKRDFVKYFTLNRLFADECEAISGRSGAALKTVVGNQIRDYITMFGDGQRHGIVEVMDADRWDAKDFGDADNAILSRILDASTKDIELWIEASRIWSPADKTAPAEVSTNGTGKEKVRSAVIDEQKYILSESAIEMMKSIEEFEYFMANIPNMMQDLASSLLESLKLFNSRSSQLILGAGATRSAGLKNITTKHLALSSQALSFIIALIPYIREFVRRHSPSSPLMAEFDRVKRLYQDHQSGIHEKLVDIMSARSTMHVNAMKKVDWEKPAGPTAVNPYMETLTKETGTLHRVLSKHLPESTVLMIMNPVFNSYREQWTRAFEEATVKSQAAKQRMQNDVEHFKTKMNKIAGSDDLGDRLLELVKAKKTEAPTSEKNGAVDSSKSTAEKT